MHSIIINYVSLEASLRELPPKNLQVERTLNC